MGVRFDQLSAAPIRAVNPEQIARKLHQENSARSYVARIATDYAWTEHDQACVLAALGLDAA